ncbi:MAG: ABC transporter substrate-binding protein [Chloroflexi bacterium]|nr:ABC transporter substrate-binding protein [Chloroflexota bacterium]
MSERNYWQRMRRSRMSRRSLLRASARAGVGAAGLALVGCGGDDDDDDAQPSGAQVAQQQDQQQQSAQQAQQQSMQQEQAEQQAEQQVQQQQAQTATAEEQQDAEQAAAQAADSDPKRGGIITYFAFDGGILDPAIADHGGLDSSIFPIYDHLNYMDEGGVLTSAMAELPEVVDDVTFVYNIKPNVHWQDKAPLNGRQFVAEDASFGLQRFGQDNPEFIWRDRFAAVDQFEVTDDLTLRLTLGDVFAPLLTAVGEIQMLMIARDVVEAFGDDAIASDAAAAIGTGGMQMVSREADVETVLERNPNYFRDGLPYFDGLRGNWNFDGAYRAAQYVAGESDLLYFPWLGFPAENEAVRGQVGEENLVEVPMNATWNWVAVHFHTKVEPYTDPRVRTALHLATDREQLLVTTQGVTEIGGPISHAIGAYAWTPDELRQLPGYRSGAQREENLAEGRRLLDASGYDPGSVPPMTTSHIETPTAEVLQQNFAEIGFEVELQEIPDSEHNPRRAAGDFTLATQGLGGVFDPDALHGTHHSDGGRNFGKFSDPGIDALLEQGRTTLGTENRVPIYDEIQTKLLEEHAPQIYHSWGRPVAGHRPWLKGYGPTNMQTAATYRWYRSWFEGKPGV